MHFCVVGAGAIGGLIAARLSKSGHHVTVIARGASYEAIRSRGIEVIESDGSSTIASKLSTTDQFVLSHSPDCIIVALKAHQISSVAPELASLIDTTTTIVSLQNGIPWWYFYREGGSYDGYRLRSLDPEGTIESNIPSAQVIGSIAFPAAIRVSPGVIAHIEGDRLPIGEPDGSRSDRAALISQAFSEAGFRSRVLADIRSHIWIKAWGNLAFNPISALTQSTLREICEFPSTRSLAADLMEEARSIAGALGVNVRLSIEQRISGAQEVGDHKTSMLQDLESSQKMEIEPLVGAFLELASLTDTPVPRITAIHALVSLLDSHSQIKATAT
ncbi:MAG: 2-dehydropantoate 2-reductase [Acidimicrobiaceae bacterium]|nr:2-dehydropantoate 2-reductase [Acidimicrobiaceae bacterium]